LDVPITADLAPLTDRFNVLIDFTRPAATIGSSGPLSGRRQGDGDRHDRPLD
jgi:hypothetical protein